MSQVPLTKPETLQADIAAAAAYLREPEGGAVKSLYSVGFCFGGAISYLQAASGLGYAGVIGFYGWPLGLKRWPDRPKPIDAVDRYKCPVLSIFGGADEGIPQADVDQFDAACKRAGVRTTSTVYPGRAAQLLRQEVRRVRRGLGRRLAPRAASSSGWAPKRHRTASGRPRTRAEPLERAVRVASADLGACGRNCTLIRGFALAIFGTACSHVRWQVPPITRRSPQPRSNARERPPPAGRSRKRRGAPSETMATTVCPDCRPMRSP